MIEFIFSGLRLSLPIVLAALAGVCCERSGVVNIALEAFLLIGAFAASVGTLFSHSYQVGWMLAIVSGLLLGSAYCYFVVNRKTHAIITGTAFNLLAIGLLPFCNKILFNSTGSTPAAALEILPQVAPWAVLLVSPFLIYFILNKTTWGLRIRFAGEKPESLQASGSSLISIRWSAVLLGSVFASLGGATLSTFLSSSYSPLMSGGRGYMALAAMIAGRWSPIGAAIAALLFGFAEALEIRMQGVDFMGIQVPVQFIQIFPFVVAILMTGFFANRYKGPSALGS